MSEDYHSAAVTAAAIEAAFDGRWGVWLSETNRWWAARKQMLTTAELTAGCVPFIQADSPRDLTERIREQEQLSSARGPDDHENA